MSNKFETQNNSRTYKKNISKLESNFIRDQLKDKRRKNDSLKNKELIIILSLSLIWRGVYGFLFMWIQDDKISTEYKETSIALALTMLVVIFAQGLIFFFLKNIKIKLNIEKLQEHHFFVVFHFIVLAAILELYILQFDSRNQVEALLWIQLPCFYFTLIYNQLIKSTSNEGISWGIVIISYSYLLIRSQMFCLNIVEAINQSMMFLFIVVVLYKDYSHEFSLHLATYKKLRISKIYHKLFEILPDGVALFSEDKSIIACNRMFKQMFPTGEEEFLQLQNETNTKQQDAVGVTIGSLIQKKNEPIGGEQKTAEKTRSVQKGPDKFMNYPSSEDPPGNAQPSYKNVDNANDNVLPLADDTKKERNHSLGNKEIGELIERRSSFLKRGNTVNIGIENKDSVRKNMVDVFPFNRLELFSRMNSGHSSKDSVCKKGGVEKTSNEKGPNETVSSFNKVTAKPRTSQWGNINNNQIEIPNNELEPESAKAKSAVVKKTSNNLNKSSNINSNNNSNLSITFKNEKTYKITTVFNRNLTKESERGKISNPTIVNNTGESPTKMSKRHKEQKLTLTVDEEMQSKSPYHCFYDKERKKRFYIKFLPMEIYDSQVTLTSIREYESEFESKILEKVNNFQNKFFSSVSHELRTPLNGAISLLTILGDVLPDSQNSDYLEPALNSLKLLLFCINDILDYQRIHSNRFLPNNQEFNLKAILDNIEKLVKSQIQERDVILKLEVDKSVPKVIKSDPIRITQIVINLLTNSIKFSSKGVILVSVYAEEENKSLITISVKDEGIGISEKRKRKLFRFDTGNSSGMIGLGLTISDMIAKRLSIDGKGIKVTSEAGKGSVFSFCINNTIEYAPLTSVMENDENDEKNIRFRSESNPKTLIKKTLSWNTSDFEDMFSNQGFALPKRETANKEFKFIEELNIKSFSKVKLKNGIILSEESIECLEIKSPSRKKKYLSNEFVRMNSTFRNPSDVMISYIRKKNDVPKSSKKQKEEIEILKDLVKNKKCKCPDILIVDDSDLNIYALKLNLNKFHMKVTTALNGEEGVNRVLELYRDSTCCKFFKLIFMDLNMPVKDGFEAAAEISEFYKQKRVNYPILACTAVAGEDQNMRSLSVGMSDFVTKPVTASALEVILLSWIDKKYYL